MFEIHYKKRVSFVSVRTETKNRVRFRVHVHAKSMSMSAPSPLHKKVLTFSFGLFPNANFCFGSFRNGSETQKQTENLFFKFHKQDRNRSSFGLFRFKPKQKKFLFRGDPTFCKRFLNITYGQIVYGLVRKAKPAKNANVN